MNDKTETYQVMSKDDEIIVSENAYDIIDVNSFQDSDEVLDAIINYYEANSGSCNWQVEIKLVFCYHYAGDRIGNRKNCGGRFKM